MSKTTHPSAASPKNDRRWYAFRNATETEVEVYLYDEIGFWGVGAKEFMAELRTHAGKHVHLRINSPGGEVIEGTAIYNALLRHQGGLTVHIDAMAASMASVIAMAGSPIFMADNALMMIHDPYTFAAGTSEELRKSADLLDTMKAALVRAYVKKTGKTEDEIASLMSEETWMGATEAAALGFIDGIEDGVQAAASMTPEKARAKFDMLKKCMSENTEPTPEAPETPETPEAPVAPVEPTAPEVTPEAPKVPETPEAPAPETPEAPEMPAPSAKVDVVALTSQITALNTRVISAEARAVAAEAALDQVSTALSNLEKSKGLAPAAVVPAVKPETSKTLTLAEFNSLSPYAKSEHFRRGGKITE